MRNKTDKIFDNSFDESDFGGKSTKFKISSAFEHTGDAEDQMYNDLLIKRIDDLIRSSAEFAPLNKIGKDGKLPKLSKIQISKVYSYIITNVLDYSKTDIFSTTSEYFDIPANKFYNCLSNAHKDALILELDKKTGILEKKHIKKLF